MGRPAEALSALCWGEQGARPPAELLSRLFQISLASRTPKDQGLCHMLEQVYSTLRQGS